MNSVSGIASRVGHALDPARPLDWLYRNLHERFLAKRRFPVFVLLLTGGLVLFKIAGAYCGSAITNQFDKNPSDFPLMIEGQPLIWWFAAWLARMIQKTGIGWQAGTLQLTGTLLASGLVFAMLATILAQLLPLHVYESSFSNRYARWGASLASMGAVYMICFGPWFGFVTGAIQGIPLLYVFLERRKVTSVAKAFFTTFLIHGLANCSVELIRYFATR